MTDKKEKPKDPWHKDNALDTMEKRRHDVTNINNIVSAMDAQYEAEVAKLLKKHGKGKIKYEILDEQHKDYNEKAANEVRELVDKTYSLESELHPLKEHIKDNKKLKDDYMNSKLIDGIYFGHKEQLKQSVGQSEDYASQMKSIQERNLKDVGKKLSEHAVGDIDPAKHGKDLASILIKETNADEKKINKDYLARDIHQNVLSHMYKQLNNDTLERKYKIMKGDVAEKYNKIEEKNKK